MTRVVLDTDVLAPGFTSVGSASSRLVDRWQMGAYELVAAEHILAELGGSSWIPTTEPVSARGKLSEH